MPNPIKTGPPEEERIVVEQPLSQLIRDEIDSAIIPGQRARHGKPSAAGFQFPRMPFSGEFELRVLVR